MSEPDAAPPAPLPQLRMTRALSAIPELVVPAGYRLRHFTPGDAEAWAALLAENGGLGTWSADTAATFFAADSRMPLEGAFFLMRGDEPVATAQLHLKPDDPTVPGPELGFVAVIPRHQGCGLAAVVSLAVLHYAASAGHQSIYLLTDDYRLAAIRTYLKLGFEPWLTDASHAARWDAVRAVLDQYQVAARDKREEQ